MKIGILGGGQLAKMLSLAAAPLGIATLCYEPVANTCANQVTGVLNHPYEDAKALKAFAESVDVITFETENITDEVFAILGGCQKFAPNHQALLVAHDRLLEKQRLNEVNIPTAPYRAVDDYASLEAACEQLQFPCVLKTRTGGYDGKGQFVIKDAAMLTQAWESLGGQPLILEGFIPFEKEISLIGVRSASGEIKTYPLTENYHQAGILQQTITPIDENHLQAMAHQYMTHLLNDLQYVGVLAIEFFVLKDQLIANEIAPRVHNTGHWTIEGAVTSQFENHVRAICHLPLGETRLREPSLMVNMIGEEIEHSKVLEIPGAHLHSYGKAPRPGRKLGHMTLCGQSKAQLFNASKKLTG